MSDERALLAAIWAEPHDDTPRLVYADWLQENGQSERAEFIRVQCELARLDEWDDVDRIAELKAREGVLWRTHAKEWRSELKPELRAADFRRGFAYPPPLRFDGDRFLKLKPRAFDAAPQWTVTLRPMASSFDAVFASPLLVRVDNLTIDDSVIHHFVQLERLATNDRVRNVSELTTAVRYWMPATLTAFLGGPAWESLVRLNLGSLDGLRFAAVRESAAAARLQHLGLNLFGDLPDAPLFGEEAFPQLRSLNVVGTSFSYQRDEAAALDLYFTRRPRTQLRRLNLFACRITDAGAEQLAAWPGLADLRWLNLDQNFIREAGFRALARSPFAGNLRHLVLDGGSLRQFPAAKAELDARFGPALRYSKP